MSENTNIANIAEIDEFMKSLKSQNLSSPIGDYWVKFFRLISNDYTCDPLPPSPLILAASCEAASIKSSRLREQLVWSLENGKFLLGIRFLKDLSSEKWEYCPEENWNKSYY